MSLFRKLFGADDLRPETIPTLEQVATALEAVAVERHTIDAARHELIERRRAALVEDAPDATVKKIDTEIERIELITDRLDVLEPRLHRRLAELQTIERRRTLDVLRTEYETVTKDLDGALSNVLPHLEKYLTLTAQIDSAGFSTEARGFVTSPPLLGEGILASRSLIEQWRRERERIADAKAASSRPYVPPPAPERVVVPIRKPEPSPTPPMSRKVEPIRLTAPVERGMTRIECLLNNVDFAGRQCVAGDQFDVSREEASYLLKGAAFRFVAGEETAEEAAQ